MEQQKLDAGFSSAKRLLFIFMSFIFDKIVADGVQKTHLGLLRNECIHKVSQFVADIRLGASSDHFSSKIQHDNPVSLWQNYKIWMRFQQDGFTCHTSKKTIQLLHELFPGSVIFRCGD